MSLGQTTMGLFLTARESRFKPNDSTIAKLKRIDKIDFSGKIYLSDKVSNTDMILVKKGDLVISGINVEKGAMCVYRGDEDITATIHYSSYLFDEHKIDIEFLSYFLKSLEFRKAIKEQVPGGIKTEIKPKHLLKLIVNIPTVIEQQRAIVVELKKRNERVASLDTELTHQLKLVKKLRQQLLQDAVMGKLVTQNPNEEPAGILLEKIDAEKKQLIKDKKLKKGKELTSRNGEKMPFKIPENWVWCRLCEITYYSEAGKSYQANEYPAQANEIGVIKTSAITTGLFLENENKILPNQTINIEKIRITKNDLIFCRASGSKGYAGKSCFVNKTPKAKLILSDKSVRYVFPEYISKKYIQIYNSTHFANDYFLKLGTAKSTSMNNITRDQFNNLIIPLPPFSQQGRIVQKVEQLMQTCDALEASIKQSQQQNEQLLQQVLREALTKEVEPEDVI